MKIFKRKIRGVESQTHYLRFMHEGINYVRNTGCTDAREANAWAKANKQRIIDEDAAAAASALAAEAEAKARAAEEARTFSLERALSHYLELTKTKRKKKQADTISSYWADFAAWISAIHGVVHLGEITKTHATAYLDRLLLEGRFAPLPGQKLSGKSARTRNDYHTNLKAIFEAAMEDSGITKNPFNFEKTQGVVLRRAQLKAGRAVSSVSSVVNRLSFDLDS